MKLSVVIPAYNEERFIGKLLTSLKSQTFPYPFEIIVVDNDSTDKTADIAKKFGALIVKEKKRGYSFACNAGFYKAKGEIIARADADYIVPENWLYNIWQAFKNDKNLIAVGGPTFPLESNWWENIFYFPGIIIWMYILKFLGRGFLFPSMAVRRQAFLSTGGFDTSIAFGEDTDMCLRLKRLGKIRMARELYIYTSIRRVRSLGIVKTIFGYAFVNQISIWRGKKATIGLEPIRVLPKERAIPQHPWLYVFALPGGLTLLVVSLISLLLFTQMGKGQEKSFAFSQNMEKNLKKVFSLQPALTGILERYEQRLR